VDEAVAILDVGKTNTKLTLWSGRGELLARRERRNATVPGAAYQELDAAGIEAWLVESLRACVALARIRAIVPVAHGAAVALVADGRLFAPPLDYEDDGGGALRPAYDTERDPFAATGSPPLPAGLNLGFQLHRLEALTGPWPDDLRILPWAQYWAWRLSGVASSEVSSLGCHSDLWRPLDHRPSDLAVRRGWARRFGDLRGAGDALGVLTPAWVAATGLPPDCVVHCGLHDSNAAMLAARRRGEIGAGGVTVLSTGTWFVAMRGGEACDDPRLEPGRDCLLNVDVEGGPMPSARCMGGREAELLGGTDLDRLNDAALPARVPELIRRGAMILPTFAPGVGPFPAQQGRWLEAPSQDGDRLALIGLYLALIAETLLSLVGAQDHVLVDGRFAAAPIFVRTLARLRPDLAVLVSDGGDDVARGALSLLGGQMPPPPLLRRIEPLPFPLDGYADRWRALAATAISPPPA
jgi:sugar (pentulose or hexulose) kinase